MRPPKLTPEEAFFIRPQDVRGVLGVSTADAGRPTTGQVKTVARALLRLGAARKGVALRARDCVEIVRQAVGDAEADRAGQASGGRATLNACLPALQILQQKLGPKGPDLLRHELMKSLALRHEHRT